MRFYSNPSLRRWASGATNDLTRDARGDVYGAAAYSLPDITAARRFFTQTGEVSAGLRLRRLKAYYTHYFAGYSALTGGNAGLKAPELGGKSYLSKTGASIDLGFFWRFQEAKMSALALVIENFIEPNIKFPATDTQGFPAEIKPFKRAINLGAAAELPLGVVVAGDILDFGNNAGRSEIRAGAEKRFTPAFALQAGYGTRNGPAFGVNLFGFNVSVAKKFPVQVSRTLSF